MSDTDPRESGKPVPDRATRCYVAVPARLVRLPLTADSSTKAADARVVGKGGPPGHNDDSLLLASDGCGR
jgi:hypothetical protein